MINENPTKLHSTSLSFGPSMVGLFHGAKIQLFCEKSVFRAGNRPMPVWVSCTPNFPYPDGQVKVQTCQGGGRMWNIADRHGFFNHCCRDIQTFKPGYHHTPVMDKDTAKIQNFLKTKHKKTKIDDTVYPIRASLKDLGKLWFAFSWMEIGAEALRGKM